jgi:N-acetylmuramoyl-L-alanine amidase
MLEKIKLLLQECIKLIDSQPSVGYGEKPEPKYKFGIIIPHTKNSPGASSPDKVSEYRYALEMAPTIGLKYYTRDEAGVLGAAKNLANWGANASLECHLNAYNGAAKGFEILVLADDTESARVAELMAEIFKQKYPDRVLRHSNGVKKIKSGDRGYSNLRDAKKAGMKIALLSEAFFIDNPAEWISPEEMGKFWKEVLV